MKEKIFYLAVLIAALNINIFAGDRSNARSTSMSFSTLISGTGNDAYGINPANFDYTLQENKIKNSKKKMKFFNPHWEFTIFSGGGGYGSDSSIEFYNNYLKYLSIDRNKFANLFTNINEVFTFRNTILPTEKTDVNYDFELNWLSVNYKGKFGALNFSIADRVGLNTEVNSRDEYLPLTFGFNFNQNGSYNITNVQMAQSEAIAWWIRKYSIGYAKQWNFKKGGIKSFSAGISGSLVHGFGNVTTYESKLDISTWGIQNINGTNHVDSIKGKQDFHTQSALTDYFKDYNDGAETHFSMFPRPAGVGYSIDFGLSLEISNEWKIAASVTDLGKISWDYNTITNDDTNHFAYYNFYVTGTDPTYNQMVNDLGGYETQDTNTTFSTDMPTKYRAGIMFKPSNKFLAELNWVKGTNNLPGNSSDNIFSLGLEYYPISYLPLRTGFSAGGPGLWYISVGTGIKFKNFTFDIGTYGINQLIMNKRFSVSATTKIIF
ncbi:MAG: hypothetical protein IT280_03235 [Ignavibacteria bacterium]|nr:hypothetical protein [Ignavibacteria bacterium]